METAKLVTVLYNPEHWNPRCGCMIPAAWEAHVLTPPVTRSQRPFVCRIMGVTREEAISAARDEYPDLTTD